MTNNYSPVDFDPFAGPELIRVANAIEPQQEIWVSCLMGGADANRSYNESVSLQLKGILSLSALQSALRDTIQRHEALRSAFSADGKKICIYRDFTLDLVYEDLSSQDPLKQQQFIRDFSRQDAQTAFDLVNGPLFRTALFKLSEEEHFFKFTAHHIVCDGWSLGILMQDISALYSAYVKGITPSLAPAVPFSQYAIEQAAFINSPDYEEIEQFWIDQYKESIPVLDIPTDFPRPSLRTYKSQRDDYPISRELVTAVKKTGAGAGCSLVITLLSAFEVFLHRITGQQDIALGLPAAGQAATGHQRLVGHCVNLLPLRSQPSGQTSFIEYLRQRKSKILDAYDHQQFTFGSLLKKLNITRDPSRIPLVPVVFNIDMGLDNDVDFFGLQHRLVYNPREYENFEIFLNISGSESALTLEWSYNTQLFLPATIRRLMDEFEFLLKELIKAPSLPIREIPQKDAHLLLDQLRALNDTAVPYPSLYPLHQLIEQQTVRTPESMALQFQAIKLSYRKLNDSANQLARLLLDKGIKRGDTVGLSLDRSPEMVIALLAILKAGGAYIPLDPAYPKDRIEFMLEDASARFLLTSKKYKGHFQSKATEILLEDHWEKLSSYPKDNPECHVTGQDLAYVLYTSGSTGKPKGVQIEHHNLVNFMLSMQKKPGLSSRDRLLAVTTISFDIAGLELYLPLISGGTLVLADAASAKDGRVLLEMVRTEKITIMQATPSTWRMMLDAGWDSPLPVKVLCGGEGLPKSLTERILPVCAELWNMYGPTETTIWSTTKKIEASDETISIGRPIDNTQVYILDETRRPVARGSIGEIYIGGEGVTRGYLNRPELNAVAFSENTFFAQTGAAVNMYKTGDQGRLMDNGDILCLGRIDHQVKLRGFRIELGEIEYRLNQQRDIKEAIVIVREDRQGDQRLVAYIVPVNQDTVVTDAPVPLDLQRAWEKELKEVLPAYMIPNEYVLLPQFPLTANGKIDRKALPKPVARFSDDQKKYVPPSTELEKLIADAWKDALGLSKVSIQDDFFELGGHSMIAIQVITRLEKILDQRLPLTLLVQHPTIERLAAELGQKDKAISWSSLVPLKPDGSKMPLYIIHGAGLTVLIFNALAKSMDPDQPVYGLQARGLNGVDEPLDKMEDIAAAYLAEIMEHNPDGPYCLAGYSFGGFVAYEMAAQLLAKGKEVKMLGIFDTSADNTSEYFDSLSRRLIRKAGRQLPKFRFILRTLLRYPKETLQYQGLLLRRKIRKVFEKMGLMGKLRTEEEILDHADKINEKLDTAFRNYRMVPLNVTMDIFRVKTRIYYIKDPLYLGWKPFALKGVATHEVPGDHKTFLMSPHYKEMARILQASLDERTAVKKENVKGFLREPESEPEPVLSKII